MGAGGDGSSETSATFPLTGTLAALTRQIREAGKCVGDWGRAPGIVPARVTGWLTIKSRTMMIIWRLRGDWKPWGPRHWMIFAKPRACFCQAVPWGFMASFEECQKQGRRRKERVLNPPPRMIRRDMQTRVASPPLLLCSWCLRAGNGPAWRTRP